MNEMMSGVPPQREQENPQKQTVANQRQQAKIIMALESGDLNVLGGDAVTIEAGTRNAFLKKLAEGGIQESQLRELVQKIAPPAATEGQQESAPFALFAQIVGDKQMRGIVAKFTDIGFANRDVITAEHLGAFLQKYPDPALFELEAQGFLNELGRVNGPEKKKQYEKTLREFLRIVYGKRWEYSEQIKLLQEEAERRFPENAESHKIKNAVDKAMRTSPFFNERKSG